MSNLREAAQQALEALKDYKRSDDDRVSIAMHILSTALEQEQAEPVQEPVAWMIYSQDGRSAYVTDNPTDVVDVQRALPLYAALKQERAEPVAWRTFDGEGGFDYRDYEGNEGYAAEWAQRNPSYAGWVEPLFTAPPQRKPLTDEEIYACFHAARNAKLGAAQDNSKHRLSVVEIARAIERAHGIGEEV